MLRVECRARCSTTRFNRTDEEQQHNELGLEKGEEEGRRYQYLKCKQVGKTAAAASGAPAPGHNGEAVNRLGQRS